MRVLLSSGGGLYESIAPVLSVCPCGLPTQTTVEIIMMHRLVGGIVVPRSLRLKVIHSQVFASPTLAGHALLLPSLRPRATRCITQAVAGNVSGISLAGNCRVQHSGGPTEEEV